MSVKVGVRVRPFNQREQELGCRLCVEMQNVTTRLLDLEDPKKNRDFAFDYSFWSHDEFEVDENGYNKPATPKYADQQTVYQAVGAQILDNAWQGYHCCLFAYGQTGAGKSYSMIGYGANKGIVPISCQQIFTRIHKNQEKSKQFQVNVSMLEIYNQKVQDLLVPVNKRPKEGLKIREHKTLGIYVEGLSKHYVDTYEAIEAKMQEGNRHRSVAATEMNASSSRAHTIIGIEFRQKEQMHDKKVEKLSVIYLVDLAGSERVQKTGAEGTRLKEAAGINKSLSVLGLVISCLADKAMGKAKNVVVPYRDSCLTRILQNALGGNSKTLMICAISPATDNYEQTLSTLRYADQAKKIQNKAIVNQSETDRMIRTLTEENEKLKKYMEMLQKLGVNLDEHSIQKFNEAQSELAHNNEVMKDYAMTKTEKMEKQGSFNEETIDITKPHLINLNEDPLLSKKIRYAISIKENTLLGKKNANPVNDIILGGAGVKSHHAVIRRKETDEYFIRPYDPIAEGDESHIFINGQAVNSETQLFSDDRLIVGVNSTFLVIIPGGNRRLGPELPAEIDWEFAQEQMYQNKKIDKEEEEAKEIKLKQEQELALKEKQQELEKLRKIQMEQQTMVKQIQKKSENEKAEIEAKRQQEKERLRQELERMKADIESQKKKIQETEEAHKKKVNQKNYIVHKLTKYIPKVIETNVLAQDFKRNISMTLKLLLIPDEFESKTKDGKDGDRQRKAIKVQVDNRQAGYTYFWDIEKFSMRYYAIKDLFDRYLQSGQIPVLTQEDDPFWDPPEHILIGNGFLTMLSLAYMMDHTDSLALVAENGDCGVLDVALIPTDETGQINLSSELDENEQQVEPENLIGKPYNFTIEILHATIPDGFENIFVEYSLKLNGVKETFKTEIVKERTRTPKFNYKKNHRIENVIEEQINYLQESNVNNHPYHHSFCSILCFKVYGQEYIKEAKKPEPEVKPVVIKKISTNVRNVVDTTTTVMPAQNKKTEVPAPKKPIAPSVPVQKPKDKDCTIF